MIFVYVLISNLDDFYAEEMLLSLISLRKYHPHDRVVVLTDKETVGELQYHRKDIFSLVDEIKRVAVPENLNNVQRSRFLKTSIDKYIDHDFIFLDTDTIVSGKLRFSFIRRGDIRAVYAAHGSKLSNAKYEYHFVNYYAARGISYNRKDYPLKGYFNSGVLFCKKTENTKKFFKEWHSLWLKSSMKYSWNQDQVDFCLANMKTGNIVRPLDGIYNCQILYADSVKYFAKAKIIHYYSKSPKTSYFKFRNPEYLLQVRYHGVTETIDQVYREAIMEYKEKMSIWIAKEPIAGDSIIRRTKKILKPRVKIFINFLSNKLSGWKDLK